MWKNFYYIPLSQWPSKLHSAISGGLFYSSNDALLITDKWKLPSHFHFRSSHEASNAQIHQCFAFPRLFLNKMHFLAHNMGIYVCCWTMRCIWKTWLATIVSSLQDKDKTRIFRFFIYSRKLATLCQESTQVDNVFCQ